MWALFTCTERTENDRVAEPIDSAVSSPAAYLALGLLYTVAALPALVAPQAVRPALCDCSILVLLLIRPLEVVT